MTFDIQLIFTYQIYISIQFSSVNLQYPSFKIYRKSIVFPFYNEHVSGIMLQTAI